MQVCVYVCVCARFQSLSHTYHTLLLSSIWGAQGSAFHCGPPPTPLPSHHPHVWAAPCSNRTERRLLWPRVSKQKITGVLTEKCAEALSPSHPLCTFSNLYLHPKQLCGDWHAGGKEINMFLDDTTVSWQSSGTGLSGPDGSCGDACSYSPFTQTGILPVMFPILQSN